MLRQTLIKALCCIIPQKERRRMFRKKMEFKCGCMDFAQYSLFYDSIYNKQKGLIEAKENIDTLILGDSHAQFGVFPVLMGKGAYNYSFNANGLYENFESLKQANSLCPRLQKIVMTISFYNGAFCEMMGENLWKCQILNHLVGFKYDFSTSKNPNYDFFEKIIDKLRPDCSVKCYSQGYDYVGMHIGEISDKSLKRILKHCQLAQKYDNQWVWLEKICDYCKEHNLQLSLVNSPLRSDYRRVANEMVDEKKMLQPAVDLCQKNDCLFLDAGNLFTDDDFADCDHLNINGAIKYTRFISEHI